MEVPVTGLCTSAVFEGLITRVVLAICWNITRFDTGLASASSSLYIISYASYASSRSNFCYASYSLTVFSIRLTRLVAFSFRMPPSESLVDFMVRPN